MGQALPQSDDGPSEIEIRPFYEMEDFAEIATPEGQASHDRAAEGLAASLYDRLLARLPSPVVALNRAVAHAMAEGPHLGLTLLAYIEASGALDSFAPFHAAKGDMLFRLGDLAPARTAYQHAVAFAGNETERRFLLERVAACSVDGPQ